MDRVARPRRIDVPPRTRWPAEPGACPRKLVDSHMDRTRDTAVDGERRGAGGLPLRYCTDPLSRPAGPPLPCTVVSTVVRKLVGSVRRTRPPREFCQNHGQNSHPVSFILYACTSTSCVLRWARVRGGLSFSTRDTHTKTVHNCVCVSPPRLERRRRCAWPWSCWIKRGRQLRVLTTRGKIDHRR